jgi:D-alanyl-D-alanine dipeptidase
VQLRRALLALAFLTACSSKAPRTVNERPDDIVDVRSLAPDVLVEMAYFGADNFMGRPVVGYRANRCLLARPAAKALARASAALLKKGLFLKARDCYRPQKAVDSFVAWSLDPSDVTTKARFYPSFEKKTDLFEQGYIAKRSGHSRGSTIDVVLVVPTDFGWQEVDMGTPYDYLDAASNTESAFVSQEALARRKVLVDALAEEGFANYRGEWWHYTYKPEAYTKTFFDFDVE